MRLTPRLGRRLVAAPNPLLRWCAPLPLLAVVACNGGEAHYSVDAPELYVVDHLTAGMTCNQASAPPGAAEQPESQASDGSGEGSDSTSGGPGTPCGGDVNAGGISGGAFFGGGIANGCGDGGPSGGGGGLQAGGTDWELPSGGGAPTGEPQGHPAEEGLSGGGGPSSGLGEGVDTTGVGMDLHFDDDYVVLPDHGLDPALCCYVEHCPDGVSPECPFVCGDGVLDPEYELCDGDCDSIVCAPSEACAPEITTGLQGRASLCNVRCGSERRRCVDGDGCCPAVNGCNYANDVDCPAPDGEVGSPCLTDDDCDGYTCLPQEAGFLGGYCTPNAIALSTCPDGTALTTIPEALTLYCPAICEDDEACREGYACYTPVLEEYPVTVCARYAEGEGQLGDPCEGYWDCAGGEDILCVLGRCAQYCDEALGAYEAGCPGDAYCQNDRCQLPCTTCFDGDGCCPDFETTGVSCTVDLDLDCAAPETDVGSPCTEDADCGDEEGIRCLTEAELGFPGGFCTVELGFDRLECPEGSVFSVVQLPSGEGLTVCSVPCAADAECRDDYVCWNPTIQEAQCSPAAIGSADLDDSCTMTIECGGDRWTYCDGDVCRYDCSTGNDCPAGWGCADTVCRPFCTDGTCPDDMFCITHDTGEDLCW